MGCFGLLPQVEKQEEDLKAQQSNEKQKLGGLQSQLSSDDPTKVDNVSAERMRALKSLKLKKDGLIRAIEDRTEEIELKVSVTHVIGLYKREAYDVAGRNIK